MNIEAIEELENTIVDLMIQSKIPGLSIGISIEGKIIYSKGFGARNLAENAPMTPENPLFIYRN